VLDSRNTVTTPRYGRLCIKFAVTAESAMNAWQNPHSTGTSSDT